MRIMPVAKTDPLLSGEPHVHVAQVYRHCSCAKGLLMLFIPICSNYLLYHTDVDSVGSVLQAIQLVSRTECH